MQDYLVKKGFTIYDWMDDSWQAIMELDHECQLIVREDETLLCVGKSYWPMRTVETIKDVDMLLYVVEPLGNHTN